MPLLLALPGGSAAFEQDPERSAPRGRADRGTRAEARKAGSARRAGLARREGTAVRVARRVGRLGPGWAARAVETYLEHAELGREPAAGLYVRV